MVVAQRGVGWSGNSFSTLVATPPSLEGSVLSHLELVEGFSRAAGTLGLADEARALREQAAAQGSIEAQRGLP
jgi:hypothetical protein